MYLSDCEDYLKCPVTPTTKRVRRVRFLVSQVFSEEIASQRHLEQTFQCNEKPVIQILTEGLADCDKYNAALQYSLARCIEANTEPILIRTNAMKLRYRQSEKERSSQQEGDKNSGSDRD